MFDMQGEIVRIPMDREQWSEQSKRSCAYDYAGARTYADIAYCCSKCNAEAIFTAAEQKLSYEVKKQYIWRGRTLCGKCNGELFRLKLSEREFQKRWAQERATLKNDRTFLAEWLAVLAAIPLYRHRTNSSMKNLLEKLLQSPDCPPSE